MKNKKLMAYVSVAWTSVDITEWQRACVERSGGDPNKVPEMPFQFLRLPEVIRRTGLPRSTIYRKMSEGKFPKPVKLDN